MSEETKSLSDAARSILLSLKEEMREFGEEVAVRIVDEMDKRGIATHVVSESEAVVPTQDLRFLLAAISHGVYTNFEIALYAEAQVYAGILFEEKRGLPPEVLEEKGYER